MSIRKELKEQLRAFNFSSSFRTEWAQRRGLRWLVSRRWEVTSVRRMWRHTHTTSCRAFWSGVWKPRRSRTRSGQKGGCKRGKEREWVCGRLGSRKLGCRKLGCRKLGCRKLGCRMLGCRKLGCRMLGCRIVSTREEGRSLGWAGSHTHTHTNTHTPALHFWSVTICTVLWKPRGTWKIDTRHGRKKLLWWWDNKKNVWINM